jgi:hypothetical protein
MTTVTDIAPPAFAAADFDLIFGVQVADFSSDDEDCLLLLGHHLDRVTAAAVARYTRWTWGRLRGPLDAPECYIERAWGRFVRDADGWDVENADPTTSGACPITYVRPRCLVAEFPAQPSRCPACQRLSATADLRTFTGRRGRTSCPPRHECTRCATTWPATHLA